MKTKWVTCIVLLGAFLMFNVPIASALILEANGIVDSGGICTDVEPWPWQIDSVQIWENWAGKPFSLSMTGTTEYIYPDGYAGGPAVLISLTAADLIVDSGPSIDVLSSSFLWDAGVQVEIDFNSDLDWVEVGVPGGSATYLFHATALPSETLYISSQRDFGGDNISIGAWYLNSSDMSLAVVAEPVPEPATLLLFGSGLLGLFRIRKKFHP